MPSLIVCKDGPTDTNKGHKRAKRGEQPSRGNDPAATTHVQRAPTDWPSCDVAPRASVKRSLSCPAPAAPMLLPSPVQDPNSSSRSVPNRRRPVLIDDSTYLRRLSVLLETHGAEEAEEFIHSPDMAETVSFPGHAHSRSSSEKVKQITGDQLAEALHAAKIAEASCPWFLRPIHDKDQIRLEYDGNIVGGTLPAIVERLTLDPLSEFDGSFPPSNDTQFIHHNS